ncbi:extracellular solute-binding protein [Bacillus licheniformis]|nr:extracellular solute-binding protein [Bacillus licheniformis]
MPFASNALALFYNKDLLKNAGISKPPETWSDLKKRRKNEQRPNERICPVSRKSEESAFQFIRFFCLPEQI